MSASGIATRFAWLRAKPDSSSLEASFRGPDGAHHWYAKVAHAGEAAPPREQLSVEQAFEVLNKVKEVYDAEVQWYQRRNGDKSDNKWIRDVIQAGTLSDKVAALAMQVQEAAFYNLEALDLLAEMCRKKEQRVSQLALEATKDLLIHNVLPNRPLLAFKVRELLSPKMDITTALLYYFEHELSKRMDMIVGALEAGSLVPAEHFKKFCIDVAADLLCAKPEKEARLLALIVNKLGDPAAPVTSKAVSALKKILETHPAMKAIIIREVRIFINRPNLPIRTLFSSVLFLSQIPVTKADNVATQLVECFVSLFEKAVKQEESGSRLLSALLTGINRAFPYLTDRGPIMKHLDSMFRIVHSASFTSSTQALTLISYIALRDRNSTLQRKKKISSEKTEEPASKEDTPDAAGASESPSKEEDMLVNRFYRALYDKLLDDQVSTRARNTLFMNLLYRSMKRDPSVTRLMAFVKRMMIVATQSSSSIAAAIVYLLSEVCLSRPELLSMLLEFHESDAGAESTESSEQNNDSTLHNLGNYNGEKREPSFATNGKSPNIWEGVLMRHHFHPSVQAFTEAWIGPSHKVVYAGDPIIDFSISSFLNRFSYKNPKTKHLDNISRKMAAPEEPVNTEAFIGAPESAVAPDKAFFHKFFGARARLINEGKIKDRSRHKDEDEEGIDEEEEMDRFADSLADNLLRSAMGNVDGDIDFAEDFKKQIESISDDESSSGSGEDDSIDGDDRPSRSDKRGSRTHNEDDEEEEVMEFTDEDEDAELGEDDADDDSVSIELDDDSSDDGYGHITAGKSQGGKKGKSGRDDTYAEPSAKKRKRLKVEEGGGDDVFADAAEFENEMDDIMRQVSQEPKKSDVKVESDNTGKNSKKYRLAKKAR
jgi:ribosome biogenesis protein MAK21